MTAPTLLSRQLRQIGKAFIAWQRTRATSWNFSLESQPRRTLVMGLVALFVVLVVLGALKFAPRLDKYNIEQSSVVTPIATPDLKPIIEAIQTNNTPLVTKRVVEPSDTLLSLLAREKIQPEEILSLINEHHELQALLYPQPGEYIELEHYPDGRLASLALYRAGFRPEENTVTRIEREGHTLVGHLEPFDYHRDTITIDGTFLGNWTKTAKKLNIPRSVLTRLYSVWDAPHNPVTDIQKGDIIRLLYAKKSINGSFISDGRLLGVQIVHDHHAHEAFWFVDKNGHGNFYTPQGYSTTKTFMRVPLDIKDVSSEFAALRRHPITGELRPHNGTDFRAPSGSKIFAAADGVILRKGYSKNGYGNFIHLDHGHGRETVYAHMSRFAKNIKSGMNVKKGQLIGYVGMTGLATGPHLHYELKLNGIQINPRTADFPDTETLSPFEFAQFKSRIKPLEQTLASLSRAHLDENEPDAAQASDKPDTDAESNAPEDTSLEPTPAQKTSTSDSDLYEN